jgi:hypothetical protein
MLVSVLPHRDLQLGFGAVAQVAATAGRPMPGKVAFLPDNQILISLAEQSQCVSLVLKRGTLEPELVKEPHVAPDRH